MPRKGPAVKSPVIADPVYNSPIVTALINKILLHGKRSTAEAIVYDAMEKIREKTQVDPIITLKRALDNIKPQIEVKSRRVGGATYQVPVEVKSGRATTLALRWPVPDELDVLSSKLDSIQAKQKRIHDQLSEAKPQSVQTVQSDPAPVAKPVVTVRLIHLDTLSSQLVSFRNMNKSVRSLMPSSSN